MIGDTVSVITPWLNHPELIDAYEQAVSGADQLIIYDNASDPGVSRQLADLVHRHGGVYLRSPLNRYFAVANSIAGAHATGDLIIFLNNDVYATGDWLREVRADVAEGQLVGRSKQTIVAAQLDYIEGWCVAARRSTWTTIGGWDAEHFHLPFYEDVDLSQRAIEAGVMLVEQKWPITHIGGVTQRTTPGAHAGVNANCAYVMARFTRRG